jgi:hypothetical protein
MPNDDAEHVLVLKVQCSTGTVRVTKMSRYRILVSFISFKDISVSGKEYSRRCDVHNSHRIGVVSLVSHRLAQVAEGAGVFTIDSPLWIGTQILLCECRFLCCPIPFPLPLRNQHAATTLVYLRQSRRHI